MTDYDQLSQSEGIPPLCESVSPVEMDTDLPLSHHQDVSQTWLAYDRATNGSSVSVPSQLVKDVPEETQSTIVENALARHHGQPMNGSQTIMQTKEQTGVKGDVSTKSNVSLESSIWKSASSLSGLTVLGLILAVGHHSVFEFLDGKPVSLYSQTWINRLSNGATLIVRMCWTLAVGLAFQHTLWYNFQRRYIKIQSVDKLLDLRSNILGFFSFDCFRCAPVAMALATVTWLLAALPIVVPGALSVKIDPDGFNQSLPCTVPVFGQGERESVVAENYILRSLGEPSPQVQKIVNDVLLGNGIAPFSSPCGPNCTYQYVFSGPGLDCEPYPNYVISAQWLVTHSDSPSTPVQIRLNTSARLDGLPHNWISPGSPDFLEQKTFPIYAGTGFYNNSTKFGTMWIQYLKNDSTNPIEIRLASGFEPAQVDQAWQTLACTLQNTTYSLDTEFENGVSAIDVTKISSTPMDLINFISENQAVQYLDPAATLFSGLTGSIFARFQKVSHETVMVGPFVNATRIQLSSLVNVTVSHLGFLDSFIWSVRSSFMTAIPELLTNITLSMIAANAPTYNTTCLSTRTEIVYQYKPDFLILTYGLGLLATLCCLATGLHALQHNGVAKACTFSEIVAATQNPALGQALADEGHAMAARKSAIFLEQRVMYGELITEVGSGEVEDTLKPEKGLGTAAFGFEGQVTRLKKRS